MKVLLVLGSVLLVTFLRTGAAPTDEVDAAPTSVADKAVPPAFEDAAKEHVEPSKCQPVPVGYRKETLDTVIKNTSVKNNQTQTKEKVKVKTKKLKNGNTVTIIKDKSRSKTKIDELTDDYAQTNHTVTQGGIEDSTSSTSEKKHKLHEVDVHKKLDKEIIVTDKYGNVVSDTHKVKEKDKVKKKEKDVEKKTLVHTVKTVPTPTEEKPPTPPNCECRDH